MAISLRSFAKVNLGLKIGPLREDGFHELRTIYQTVALSDQVRGRGQGPGHWDCLQKFARARRRKKYLLACGGPHVAVTESAQQNPYID